MSKKNNSQAAKQLRCLMNEHNIDYYYVPMRDDHNNEYVPPHWQRCQWITGFSGSYGQTLIGLNKAYFWTDPRYFLQAQKELHPQEFQLMKQIQGVTAPISQWLSENTVNCTIGVDPRVISIQEYKRWNENLSHVHGELTILPDNLIDQIWKDRPQLTVTPVCILPEKYTGMSVAKKLQHVRHEMKTIGAKALVISVLDEIAWLFNIRANDIPFNPVAIGYAIVLEDRAIWFTFLDRISQQDLSYFAENAIDLLPYEKFEGVLQKLEGPVWLDPASTSFWIAESCDQAILIEKTSPIIMMKAIKNETELAGMKTAHRLDGIAMVKFLHWIESNWSEGMTEISAEKQLSAFRKEERRCLDLSFSTICGFGDHSAIVHYRAAQETTYSIDDTNILLIDSGGQYFEGTTDITRTIHLGIPTSEQKKHYTMVLKGHLALRHIVFPKGVCGEHINAIARIPLWNMGMDFGHGVGHGVGCYLCVHEGPQRISFAATGIPLVPGMIVSNEPGLYFDGQYGIRIENLCMIVNAISVEQSVTGHGPFYVMEDLTMTPYARRLIDLALLSKTEIEWINTYHRLVYDTLSPELPSDVRDWLKTETAPL